MNAEHEAVQLLEQLGISELPVRPTDVCRRLNIEYREQPLGSIEGMLFVDLRAGSGLISVNSGIADQGRKNFTCAHELGHYCLDVYDQPIFSCSREDIESFRRQTNPLELRANQFAAEFLMPQFLFRKNVGQHDPDWDRIKELAALAQTSLIATAMKFVSLCEYSCALVVSRDNAISWFSPSGNFKLFLDMDGRLLSPLTVAHLVFQGKVPPNGFEVVKADNWVTGPGVGPRSELLEWTLPINSYGQVYTLLFDDNEISDKEDLDYDDDNYAVEWDPPTFHKSRRK